MLSDELKSSACMSAWRITLSPHEWTWTQKEQEEMAKYIVLLSNKVKAADALRDACAAVLNDVETVPLSSRVSAEDSAMAEMHEAIEAYDKALGGEQFPFEVDPSLPDDTIEFRDPKTGDLVGKIENIGESDDD